MEQNAASQIKPLEQAVRECIFVSADYSSRPEDSPDDELVIASLDRVAAGTDTIAISGIRDQPPAL